MYRHCRSLRVAASALALSVAMPAMAPAATRDGAGERAGRLLTQPRRARIESVKRWNR